MSDIPETCTNVPSLGTFPTLQHEYLQLHTAPVAMPKEQQTEETFSLFFLCLAKKNMREVKADFGCCFVLLGW